MSELFGNPEQVSELSGNPEQLPYTPTTEDVKYSYAQQKQDEAGFDRWFAEQERQISERVWDEAIQEAESCGWLHDYAQDEMIQRNPYRGENK